MDSPELSIIIPYYNGSAYIRKTIDSVIKIHHTKEILVIDDGSDEHEQSILDRLYGNDPEVNVYRKENGGIVSARNYGLSHASGRYVMFCDQDDTAVAEVVDKALDGADDNNADIVFWTTRMTYAADRPDRPCDTVYTETAITGGQITNGLLKQILTQSSSEYGLRFAHLWMGLFGREFVLSHEISFKRFISIDDDLLFIMDAVSYAAVIDMIPDTGYLWLQNYDSRSHTKQYTSDFLAKTTDHFDYYYEVMDRAGCSADTRKAVDGFVKQAVIADSMVNWSDMPPGTEKRAQKKAVKERIGQYAAQGAWSRYYMNDDARRRRTYVLIRMRLYEGAFMYNQLVSNVRTIRHWGRLRYDGLMKVLRGRGKNGSGRKA